MDSGDQVSFYAKQVMAELDLAGRAVSAEEASVHFSLSARHLDRMRQLAKPSQPSR